MNNSFLTKARTYAVGIGDAVADRTINRLIDGKRETWEDVSLRVAVGNSMLNKSDEEVEFHAMHHHLRQASILMSGRHLQHGDDTQPTRPMEVFTNCSTSALSFMTFYLLLNGSGVGRAYDDAMMLVDWSKMPTVVPVINIGHSDVASGEINGLSLEDAQHLYDCSTTHVFTVPDSREGWAKAIEKMEVMAHQEVYVDDVLILDFSNVRPRGAPIAGMQDRPASGPGPLMSAIDNINRVRSVKSKWRQTMYVDHYVAECVLVGGARRAARMSTKTWRDKNVIDFINVKRGGFLWSSNNSITVDQEFWDLVKLDKAPKGKIFLHKHAKRVFDAATKASYFDMTGEPGFINQDKLAENRNGVEEYKDGDFISSSRYDLLDGTKDLAKDLAKVAVNSNYMMIVNPCGEISIFMLGAYCVIADVVPYHASSDEDAEDAFRTATRALIRTNTMDAMYSREVTRTNRIGVGITGFHEWVWERFGYGFKDIIDEEKSLDMWLMLARFKRAVESEAKSYSEKLGIVVPHTNTTQKPAGTTSKLFGLSEGAHLPSMREYMRWVQFRNDDPLIAEYDAMGYPSRKLKTYSGTTIVGFPTQPEICTMSIGDKLVTAAEATPEEQYEYLRLLEKYWIAGVEEDGVTPLSSDTGNQISYTLKYKPDLVSYDEFSKTLLDGQSSIRCCSVMPQTEATAYEYQPEQPMNKHEYEVTLASIRNENGVKEDIGKEHVGCEGACSIDFEEGSKSEVASLQNKVA